MFALRSLRCWLGLKFIDLFFHSLIQDEQIIGTRSVDAGKDRVEEVLALIEKHRETIVGIGEVGLDYVPRNCPNGEADKQSQRDVLSRQAEIAHRLDLPLNVHSRSAGKPTIAFLKVEAQNGSMVVCDSACLCFTRNGRETWLVRLPGWRRK